MHSFYRVSVCCIRERKSGKGGGGGEVVEEGVGLGIKIFFVRCLLESTIQIWKYNNNLK